MNQVRIAYRVVLGTLAASCVWGLVQLHAGEPRQQGPLNADTGRVVYRFSRAGLAGNTVFAWADHGYLYRQDLSIPNAADNDTVLGRGLQFWTLHASARQAQQAQRSPNDLWMNAESVPYVAPDTGVGEVVGPGKVLDRPCEIRQIHGMHVWFWQGLPLRMERAPGSKLPPISLVATELTTGQALPPDYFELPAAYTVTDFPGHQRHPWTTIATTGLSALLVLIGIGGWAVETSFARGKRNVAADRTLYEQ